MKLRPALFSRLYASKTIPMHLKHTVVNTKLEENILPKQVEPINPASLPKGNLIQHILEQYKGDTGKYNVALPGWQKNLGEGLVRFFNLDMDRIRSGPVAGALYKDQCKAQAYFEKNQPLLPIADFYYNRLGMPQTFFQWFQVTSFHVWMLYVRMRSMPRRYCREYQRKLIDGVFEDVDFQLREVIRVHSDRTTNNYKKRFSEQLKGSIFSYDEGLLAGDAVLAGAIWRNLFERSPLVDPTVLEHMVHFARSQLYVLDRISDADFAAGRFVFLDPRCRYEPLTQHQNDALVEMIEGSRKDSKLETSKTRLSRDGW